MKKGGWIVDFSLDIVVLCYFGQNKSDFAARLCSERRVGVRW